MANKAKAYGGRPSQVTRKPGGNPLQYQSHRDRRERGPQSNNEGAKADHDSAQGDQEMFRANRIEKFAPGHLSQKARGSADTQKKADLFL